MEVRVTQIQTFESFFKDDLTVVVPITFNPESSVQSVMGGIVEGLARRRVASAEVVEATVAEVVDATTVRASFAEETLPAGLYDLQIRVTVSGETQTVLNARLTVLESL